MGGSPRAVFDCNVLLQALLVPSGPAGLCVQLAIDNRIHLHLSLFVVNELREVASRPKIVSKFGLTEAQLDRYMVALTHASIVHHHVLIEFVYDRDPADAAYVNLALAAGASLIVSRDKDLLDLITSAQAEAKAFRSRFPALSILTPEQFLAEVFEPT